MEIETHEAMDNCRPDEARTKHCRTPPGIRSRFRIKRDMKRNLIVDRIRIS